MSKNKKYSPYTFISCDNKIIQCNSDGNAVSSIQTDNIDQLAKYIGDLDELLFKARKDLRDTNNDLSDMVLAMRKVISDSETKRSIS